MDTINIKEYQDKIVITIPVSLLKFAAENNPEIKMTVVDEKTFRSKVMFELANNLGSNETGLTGFQELIDEAIIKVAETDDCIELVED